jgi:hypothetical protein
VKIQVNTLFKIWSHILLICVPFAVVHLSSLVFYTVTVVRPPEREKNDVLVFVGSHEQAYIKHR